METKSELTCYHGEKIVKRDMLGISSYYHSQNNSTSCDFMNRLDVDADDLGRDILVAHRHEGATDAAAHQVERRHNRQNGEEQQKEIEMALGVEADTEQARPFDLDRRLGAGS